MGSIVDIALTYAAKGLHVFPLRQNSKLPIYGSRGFLDATVDIERIKKLFENHIGNIGIAVEPSKLFIFDYDGKKGAKGKELFKKHFDEGRHKEAQIVETPNGFHVIYRSDESNNDIRAIKIVDGLDVFSRAQFIVAPPSVADGRHYRVIQDAPTLSSPPVGMVAAVRVAIAKRSQTPKANQPVDAAVFTGGEEPIPEGGRNDTLFKLACRLRQAGLSESAMLAAVADTNALRCNPPLPGHEISLLVRQASKYEPGELVDLAETAFAALKSAKAKSLVEPTGEQDSERETPLKAITKGWIGELAKTKSPPVKRYSTTFDELDKLLHGGFPTQGLTTIYSGPGAGKSAFVLNFADFHARQGTPILLISTELTSNQVQSRLVANRHGLIWSALEMDRLKFAIGADLEKEKNKTKDGKQDEQSMAVGEHQPGLFSEGDQIIERMRSGYLSPDPISEAHATHVIKSETLENTKIFYIGIDDIAKQQEKRIPDLVNVLQQISGETGQDPIVIVDYLQQFSTKSGLEQLTAVNEMLADLRRLASVGDGYCIVCVSTVSRGFYASGRHDDVTDPTFFLSAGKETGQIEYDSVVVLYLSGLLEHESGWYPTRIAVAKCRSGQTGFAHVKFHKASGQFIEADESIWTPPEKEAKPKRKAFEAPESKNCSALVGPAVAAIEATGNPIFTSKRLADHMGVTESVALQAIADQLRRGILCSASNHPATGEALKKQYWIWRKR